MLRGSSLAMLLLALLAAPARAGNASWHATASGDVAATDNVFAVPRNANPEGDMFMQLRPGMLFAYDGPRMIQELTAEVEFLEYIRHSDNPSLTERVGWKAFFLAGPRSELTVIANGSTGQLNALTARSTPDQTTIGVLPTSTAPIDTYQADVTETGSWTSSKDTHLSQTGFARGTATNDNAMMPTKTAVVEAGGSLGFEYAFKSDSLGLDTGASYLRLDRDAPPGVMPGSLHQRQVNPRATVVWRHDIDKHWSAALDGGAIYVAPIGASGGQTAAPFPLFGAQVAYTELWGRAILSARRSVTPNLFVALNTVNDTALAQIALPLPWLDDNPHARLPKLAALASIGVERAQLIDPTNADKLDGTLELVRVDAALSWTPRGGQTWGLRYEIVYQKGDSTSAIPTQSFYRNTLYLTFTLRFPDRMAGQVPRRTQSVRADRKDLSPVGAEPVVPDPTEQLQEGDDSGDNR